jgi:hypothetical protein
MTLAKDKKMLPGLISCGASLARVAGDAHVNQLLETDTIC